jgi:SAM-dependent methyltransferase
MSLSEEQRSAVSPVQYARAIHCNNFEYMPQVDPTTFVKTAKSDWDLRATKDPSLFVCAEHNASEKSLRDSGLGDTLREFVPRLKDYPHDTILEIGCGMGRMSLFIADYAVRYYGVDISGKLIDIAMKRLTDYRVEHGTDGKVRYGSFLEIDGMSLGDAIPVDSVDFAFEYIVFQHISSEEVIKSYVRDVCRVLKLGGVFVLQGRDIYTGIGGASEGNTWHGCRLGPELIREAIKGTPFVVVEEEGVGTERYWATLQKV